MNSKLPTIGSVKSCGESKLSVLAQFDDMCRFTNTLMSSVDEQNEMTELINKCENNRIVWLSTQRELSELEEENKELKSNLELIRSEIDKFKKQSYVMKFRLNALKNFILQNKLDIQNEEIKQNLLLYLDLDNMNEELDSESFYSAIVCDTNKDNLCEFKDTNKNLHEIAFHSHSVDQSLKTKQNMSLKEDKIANKVSKNRIETKPLPMPRKMKLWQKFE